MTVDANNLSQDLSADPQRLIYDTDGVTLIGHYTDEVSAYRARRSWIEVLSNYFLLESTRDYEMSVRYSNETQFFVLTCSFSSACGRYAFWRLINHQAPEAEEKLSNGLNKPPKAIFSSFLGSSVSTSSSPWVISAKNKPLGDKRRFTDRLLGLLGLN